MAAQKTTPVDRRQQRRIELRQRVLEASEALFAEKGYEGTKVADICARAEIAYGTFFNHFSEKRDLLRALAERAQRNLAEALEELAKHSGTIEEQLLLLFEGGPRGWDPAKRELLGHIWMTAATDAPEDRDRRFHAAFEAFLVEGVARGRVRDDVPVETMAEIISSAISQMALSWVHIDEYPLRERAAAAARFLAGAVEAPKRRPRRRA